LTQPPAAVFPFQRNWGFGRQDEMQRDRFAHHLPPNDDEGENEEPVDDNSDNEPDHDEDPKKQIDRRYNGMELDDCCGGMLDQEM
jgi:hypothetical protein